MHPIDAAFASYKPGRKHVRTGMGDQLAFTRLVAGVRLIFAALAVAVFAAMPSGPAWAQTPAPQSTADIRSYVSASFQNRNLPGAAVVVIRDGDIQVIAYGEGADGEAIAGDTPFYIGSMSKAFTAAAILQLVERGRLTLDAPVRTYIPDFTLADPRAAGITVRQLLNHTSGMDNSTFDEWRQPQPKTLQEAVLRLRKAGLARDPGAGFNYHNPNYMVLARLVEVVSVRPFSDYMRENIFVPLGMSDTTSVDFVDERRQGAPRGHISAFAHFFPIAAPRFFISGAGGVLTTPNDYAKWMLVQVNGGAGANGVRILSQASLQAMQTPSAKSAGYGFGWNRDASGRLSHSGGLPTYGGYVAMQGRNAVAILAPVVSVAAPSREIALGVLDGLQDKALKPLERDALAWVDFALLGLLLLIWASCARAILKSGSWARAMMDRPLCQCVLSFAPHLVLVVGVFFGVPFLVSRVISWSWVWLWCTLPVGVTVLLSSAAAAALVAAIRLAMIATRGSNRRRLSD